MIDLDTVTATKVTPDGVLTITLGNLVSRRLRVIATDCLRMFTPDYATYRRLKYPRGEGSDTHESRVEAAKFAMSRMTGIVINHYARLEDLSA